MKPFSIEKDRITEGRATARCLKALKDPPGQKSFYILPGDSRCEAYRVRTFKQFSNNEVDPYTLAINGFYFTGYRDRVKCFACGMSVENWRRGDDSDFHRWHYSDCEFMNGNDNSNIPLKVRKVRRQYKALTQNTSETGVSTSGGTLLNAGNETFQRFQTFSLESSHTPPSEHENASANATSSNHGRENSASLAQSNHLPFNNGTPNHVPPPSSNEAHSSSSPRGSTNNVQNGFGEHFPCLNPINPHMRSTQQRLQTFLDREENWPRHRINASPQEISQAGFFYLGERDRAKCWYCNGGLQNWERNDVAWEEHAKWFPMCEYLLQQKGPQYVREIVARNPNVRRPNLHNPPANFSLNSSTTSRNGSVAGNQINSGPIIIDPREKLEEQQKKIDKEMSSSRMVANAKMMGYSEEVIRVALKSQYELHDEGFSSLTELLENLINLENDREETEVKPKSVKKSPEKNKLKSMMEAKKCRVCREKDICVVLTPCGHLACCQNCSEKVKKCPICNSHIRERIRSYLS